MQRLGRILHISPSRNMIVKAENTPKMGETVVDENLRQVGKVFDLLGPASSPYVAVRPTVAEFGNAVGRMLYSLPSERRKEKNMNGRFRRRA